jgi:hypothetical protein
MSDNKNVSEDFTIKGDPKLIGDGNINVQMPPGYEEKSTQSLTISSDTAIKTLIIGCRLAQEKGVYTLEEARTIIDAIDFLNLDK